MTRVALKEHVRRTHTHFTKTDAIELASALAVQAVPADKDDDFHRMLRQAFATKSGEVPQVASRPVLLESVEALGKVGCSTMRACYQICW